MPGPLNLLDLPDDAFFTIVDKLQRAQDVRAVSRVCRHTEILMRQSYVWKQRLLFAGFDPALLDSPELIRYESDDIYRKIYRNFLSSRNLRVPRELFEIIFLSGDINAVCDFLEDNLESIKNDYTATHVVNKICFVKDLDFNMAILGRYFGSQLHTLEIYQKIISSALRHGNVALVQHIVNLAAENKFTLNFTRDHVWIALTGGNIDCFQFVLEKLPPPSRQLQLPLPNKLQEKLNRLTSLVKLNSLEFFKHIASLLSLSHEDIILVLLLCAEYNASHIFEYLLETVTFEQPLSSMLNSEGYNLLGCAFISGDLTMIQRCENLLLEEANRNDLVAATEATLNCSLERYIEAALSSGSLAAVKYAEQLTGKKVSDLEQSVIADALTIMYILHAGERGAVEVLRYCCEQGFDVETRNKNKETLLHVLFSEKYGIYHVDEMIEAGADPMSLTTYGTSILHFAAESNYPRHVVKAFELGVDVHMENNDGETALDYAHNSRIVRLLLEKGASPWITRSEDDRTLLSIFNKAARFSCCDVLLSHESIRLLLRNFIQVANHLTHREMQQDQMPSELIPICAAFNLETDDVSGSLKELHDVIVRDLFVFIGVVFASIAFTRERVSLLMDIGFRFDFLVYQPIAYGWILRELSKQDDALERIDLFIKLGWNIHTAINLKKGQAPISALKVFAIACIAHNKNQLLADVLTKYAIDPHQNYDGLGSLYHFAAALSDNRLIEFLIQNNPAANQSIAQLPAVTL